MNKQLPNVDREEIVAHLAGRSDVEVFIVLAEEEILTLR
jgi:hypothetical protein